jgi:hypothetical protein
MAAPELPASVSGRAGRALASAAILVYLAAVVIAPLSGPPPASQLSQTLLQPFRPLLGALYLGHGYRFFAPDPGPGHSLRWTMAMPDGTTTTGQIPDAASDWPRLAKGVAGNLLRGQGGSRVRLELVEHYLPGPDEVIAGTDGDDLVTPLGTFALAEAARP